MSRFQKSRFFALLFVLSLSIGLSAQNSKSMDALVTHGALPNGLEYFVDENHAVPLATIMVSFRTGGISQNAQTSGLFHLYEHLMFDGNSLYPSQSDFIAAMNRLGVANWNGGTSTEYVDYYITVPSDKLEQGLDFWSVAMREPIFDPTQFEREKNVVINEIRGYHIDPGQIFESAVENRAFATFPWRKDVSGPEKNITDATLDTMKKIQATYYIPNNAAVLVGGDVNPATAGALIAKYFGVWAKGPTPPEVSPPHPGFSGDVRLVYPDSTFYNGVGLSELEFRGPDVLRQTKDTYTSDVFLFLISSPVGKFKQDIFNKVDGLYDPEHIDFSYPTSRDGGAYYFSTYFLLDPKAPDSTLKRNEEIRKAVLDEMALIAKDPRAYFGDAELALAKTKLSDNNVIAAETPGSLLSTLSFWWTTATTDYFFSYEKNCQAVSFDDIAGLIKNYIIGKPAIAAVRVKKELLDADMAYSLEQKQYGYETITADNAYWWQRSSK